jgi:N-acyl-D-aspartate/D-glutamate deacylase
MDDSDILITDGWIINGTGNPWFKADIGIIDNTIQTVANAGDMEAERRIDARGLMVSPGLLIFIATAIPHPN